MTDPHTIDSLKLIRDMVEKKINEMICQNRKGPFPTWTREHIRRHEEALVVLEDVIDETIKDSITTREGNKEVA
jgi:hypothetical protein